MSKKAHGTTEKAVMTNLRYGCDQETADRICSYNRRFAEFAGYSFASPRSFVKEVLANGDKETTFYDSVTGKPLFRAPRGRTAQ